jgi:hypothetical protein
MKYIVAKIQLLSTDRGGRRQPLPSQRFGCPVLFENLPALSGIGYDCRLMVDEWGEEIRPGDVVERIRIVFLSPDEVLPHMRPGVKFSLWEGRTIGFGEVLGSE